MLRHCTWLRGTSQAAPADSFSASSKGRKHDSRLVTLPPVPKFRSDLDQVVPYTPGRSIDEVAAQLGISDVAKLASNECPFPTWPEVVDAIAVAGAGVNRYPDNDQRALRSAVSEHLDVPEDHLWFGAGSSDLLRSIGIAMGGPGTSTVYATPSFVLYRIITHIA